MIGHTVLSCSVRNDIKDGCCLTAALCFVPVLFSPVLMHTSGHTLLLQTFRRRESSICEWSQALVCRLESPYKTASGLFGFGSWRGLRGSGLCVSSAMRDLKREGNTCRESRHAEQFHFLTFKRLFHMISVWVLFQALRQRVHENRTWSREDAGNDGHKLCFLTVLLVFCCLAVDR